MKQFFVTFLIIILNLAAILKISAQEMPDVVAARCPDGAEISNGVEFVIGLRADFIYTVTAVGLGDFDPIIAIKDRGFVRSCSDNNQRSAGFEARLPSTGKVIANETTAQARFSHTYEGVEPISIIIGDEEGNIGEFLMTLEGLVVTPTDGSGDSITLNMSRNIALSPRSAVAYMIAKDGRLDPLLRQVDASGEILLECDDAGTTSFCSDPNTLSLSESFIRMRPQDETPQRDFNAMLDLQTSGTEEADAIQLLMTSYDPNTRGEYILAFHIGIGDEDSFVEVVPKSDKVRVQRSTDGISVDCPGTSDITNGIEFVLDAPAEMQYTITVLGIEGLDPIAALIQGDELIECADDSSSANGYSADLPSTGIIEASSLHPQITFGAEDEDATQYSLMVSGFDGKAGEFLLLIEAIGSTKAATEISLVRTANLNLVEDSSAVFMFALSDALDPIIRQLNPDDETITQCDNAGHLRQCTSNIPSLEDAHISLGDVGKSFASENNAMLYLSNSQLPPINSLRFEFSGTANTSGSYVAGFHIGISSDSG